jgi:nucleotide-binding universal stress UspA family protein
MNTPKGFEKILLATDGSEQCQAAVDATIELACFSSAKVRVLHVWNLEVHHRDGHWDVEVRSEAQQLVDAAVSRLQAAGLDADGEIYRADSHHVASAIAIVARGFSADLVVVGSRGLSDWQSMFKHSVSHQVLCAVDCPVLVVRGRPIGDIFGPPKVLLAIAGGDDVRSAVRAAVAAAHAPGSKVMVVHVVQALFGAQGLAYVESDDEIKATIGSAIRLLTHSGVEADGMVAHTGPIAKSIAEIAVNWNADLIVVGSSRMNDLGSLLLGSVSHGLLHATELPVLVAERMKS